MSDQIIARTYTQSERITLAHHAFWERETTLNYYIEWALAYEENGVRCRANGYTLSEAIKVVGMISDGNLALLMDPELPARINECAKFLDTTASYIWANAFGDLVPLPDWI